MFSYVYHPNDVLVANNLDVNQLDYSNTVKAELQIPMDLWVKCLLTKKIVFILEIFTNS